MITKTKILALIPSKVQHNNRRKAQRTTWLVRGNQNVYGFFLTTSPRINKEELEDTLGLSKTIYDGEHVTKAIVKTIEYIKEVEAEWILICDNLAWLWIDRLMSDLRHPSIMGVYYEGDDGAFYIIRRSALEELPPQDNQKDLIQAIKDEHIPMRQLIGITDPIRYPKDKNELKAVLGQRPDKIIRIHCRKRDPHIAIITIALGKYDRFFGGWYESTQEYFLPSCTRHYYVFTDNDNLPYIDCEYCTVIKQEDLGWPGNTRDRFGMYLKLREEIEKNYDFVFFTQVTARLTCEITQTEAIPDAEHDWLWMTRNVDIPEKLTYDPNPRSAAYIPKQMGRIYVQGGAFGGRPKEFFQMCETCEMTLEHNRKNGISEFLNDESHMNHFILTKNPLEGWLRFWWPPTKRQAEKCKIFTLNKTRYGGFMALKNLR